MSIVSKTFTYYVYDMRATDGRIAIGDAICLKTIDTFGVTKKYLKNIK